MAENQPFVNPPMTAPKRRWSYSLWTLFVLVIIGQLLLIACAKAYEAIYRGEPPCLPVLQVGCGQELY